jgi:hypothetical protein
VFVFRKIISIIAWKCLNMHTLGTCHCMRTGYGKYRLVNLLGDQDCTHPEKQ